MTTRSDLDLSSATQKALADTGGPDVASSMGGNRSARRLQGQQLMAGTGPTTASSETAAGPTDAPQVIGPPLPLQYDPSALEGVHGLKEKIEEWERLHLKDGNTVTVEERLVLVAHALKLRGLSSGRISDIIGNAFFGSSGREVNADNLSENSVHLVYATPGTAAVFSLTSPAAATARVTFSNGASSSFTGPTQYPGLDKNSREQQVGWARNSYLSGAGRATFSGGQSMVTARQAELQAAFIADDASLSVRKSAGSPGFRAAMTDFIYDKVLNGYAEKVAFQNIPLLQSWVDANPAPTTMTPAWARQIGTQAMQLVLAYNNANIFARTHTTWYVEDEAAAQILVENVKPGLKVNFDVDNPGNIRVG